MTKLYLEYSESCSGGEICEGQENDAWPSHEDEYINFQIKSLRLTRGEHWLVEEIETKFDVNAGDLVWVVVARYYDGDSFGSLENLANLPQSASAEEADDAEIALEDDNNSDGKYRRRWFGYFSDLEDIETTPVKVSD